MRKTLTPAPTSKVGMDFPDAIREVMNGKRIARLSWKGTPDHGLLRDSFLTIFTKGEYHRWLVNDGDLNGSDWFCLMDRTKNGEN